MMEIYWGNPMTFVVSQVGDTKRFTTIEQAIYWLRKKWPVSDRARDIAIEQVEAATHCLTTVGAVRRAFASAAITAGFTLDPSAEDAPVAEWIGARSGNFVSTKLRNRKN